MATRTPKPTLDIVPPTPSPDVTLRQQLRMKDMVERVMDRTGLKKGEVKASVEATLAVLGEALESGEDINTPGLGKMRVTREKPTPRGRMMMVKLVRNAKTPDPES